MKEKEKEKSSDGLVFPPLRFRCSGSSERLEERENGCGTMFRELNKAGIPYSRVVLCSKWEAAGWCSVAGVWFALNTALIPWEGDELEGLETISCPLTAA